jgi:hypothetical protein
MTLFIHNTINKYDMIMIDQYDLIYNMINKCDIIMFSMTLFICNMFNKYDIIYSWYNQQVWHYLFMIPTASMTLFTILSRNTKQSINSHYSGNRATCRVTVHSVLGNCSGIRVNYRAHGTYQMPGSRYVPNAGFTVHSVFGNCSGIRVKCRVHGTYLISSNAPLCFCASLRGSEETISPCLCVYCMWICMFVCVRCTESAWSEGVWNDVHIHA